MKRRRHKGSISGYRLAGMSLNAFGKLPLRVIALYYLGTIPFVLGFLHFWADMSRSGYAARRCFPAAIGLTLLFLWMKSWQSAFLAQTRQILLRVPSPPWDSQRVGRLISQQSLQGFGILAIPVSMLLGFPFYAVHNFYQNLTVEGSGELASRKEVVRRAWRKATPHAYQSHVFIWLLSPWLLILGAMIILFFSTMITRYMPATVLPTEMFTLGVTLFIMATLLIYLAPFVTTVFLNVAIVLGALPHLATSLLGIESAFTVAGVFAIMNTTFMMTALFLTYLCVDPLIKVGTLLRCFFIDSQTTGSDILFELNNLPHEAGAEPAPSSASEATGQRREGGGNPARLAALLVLLSLGMPAATHAEPTTTAAPEPASTIAEPRSGDVAALDQSIRQRLDDPVYAWRMPRERDNTVDLEADMSWIEALFGPLQDMIQSFVRRFGDAIDAFFRGIERWLKELLPSMEVDRPVVAWSAWFRLLVFALLAIVISLLAILVLRFLRRREPAKSVEGVPIVAVPDLSQEHVAADRLPPNEWLDLAAELAARGELRLALRAMFLASLSDLGQRGILALALHKSNREYRRELERRAHDRRELVAAFTQNVRTLEFVWYGNHPVTDGLYREFEQNQGRIVNAATT